MGCVGPVFESRRSHQISVDATSSASAESVLSVIRTGKTARRGFVSGGHFDAHADLATERQRTRPVDRQGIQARTDTTRRRFRLADEAGSGQPRMKAAKGIIWCDREGDDG